MTAEEAYLLDGAVPNIESTTSTTPFERRSLLGLRMLAILFALAFIGSVLVFFIHDAITRKPDIETTADDYPPLPPSSSGVPPSEPAVPSLETSEQETSIVTTFRTTSEPTEETAETGTGAVDTTTVVETTLAPVTVDHGPPSRVILDEHGRSVFLCLSTDCIYLADLIRKYIDTTYDPCSSAYEYACQRFLQRTNADPDRVVRLQSVINENVESRYWKLLEKEWRKPKPYFSLPHWLYQQCTYRNLTLEVLHDTVTKLLNTASAKAPLGEPTFLRVFVQPRFTHPRISVINPYYVHNKNKKFDIGLYYRLGNVARRLFERFPDHKNALDVVLLLEAAITKILMKPRSDDFTSQGVPDFLNEFRDYTLLNLFYPYYLTYYSNEWVLRVLNRVKKAYGKDGIGTYQLFRAALELSPALEPSLLAEDLVRLGYGTDFLDRSQAYRCARLVENVLPGSVARLTAYLPDPYGLPKIHAQLLVNVFMDAVGKAAGSFREKFLLSNKTEVMYLFEPREVEPGVLPEVATNAEGSVNLLHYYYGAKSWLFQRRMNHTEYFTQEWFGSALAEVVQYNPGLNSIYIPKWIFANHIASKKNIRMWHLVTLSVAFFRGIYNKIREYDLDVVRGFDVARFRASFKETLEGLQYDLPPYVHAAFNLDNVFHDIYGDFMAYIVAEEATREYMERQHWDDYRLHDLNMTWKEVLRTIFTMHQCEKGPNARLEDYHWGNHLPAKIRTRILFSSNATKAGFGC